MFDYLHDVVEKSHVEHTVSLIEYKILHAAQVDAAELEMCDKTSGRGDDYVGSTLETILLTGKLLTVGTAVDGYTRDREIVGETFELTVNLLGEFTGRSHDDTVDKVGCLRLVGKHIDDREQISGSLARTGLSHGYEVTSLKDYRDGLFLYWGTLPESHRVKCVEHVVAQLQFVKSHPEIML